MKNTALKLGLLPALILSLLVPVFAQQTKINLKDGAEMIYIPAGEFIMGRNDGEEDESPKHKVYLDGYWIYKYEVTVAQYRKYCEATGAPMPEAPSWGWIDTHPIVNVSWIDAKDYCRWAGVRLPSEAQWEKAARGTDGRTYPWGEDWDTSKVQAEASQTVPVGSFLRGASPYGVLDLAGNAWEWCEDWYREDYYQNAPDRNPRGPSSGEGRVVRGGSWGFDAAFCRSASRFLSGRMARNTLIGFRGASPG